MKTIIFGFLVLAFAGMVITSPYWLFREIVRPTDEKLLRDVARVSGGTYNPKAEEIFAPTDRGVQTRLPLGHFFVLAAALFLVADVAVRRYHEWIGTARKPKPNLAPQESHVGGANEAA